MRKGIYFTSDFHVGHENVLTFSNRPWDNLEDMYKGLIKRYNSVVKKGDICYFLGDIGMGNFDDLKRVISQLNGTKVAILGNHDRGANGLYNAGFDVVLNRGAIYVGKDLVTFSHCPKQGVFREDTTGMKGSKEGENWHGESRHLKYTVPDEGQFHLSGHLHAPNSGKSEVKLGRQWDIGVDGNNYSPVSIGQVEKWIHEVKRREDK